MLPDKTVEEFKEIFKKKFSREISFDQAKLKAENFIQLFKLITTPPSKK